MQKRTRCKKGMRKNKSGTCTHKMYGPKKARCPKGSRRTRKGGYCRSNKYKL